MVLNNEIMELILTAVSPLSGEVYKILTKDKAKSESESNNEENILSNLEKHTDLLKELAIIRRIDTAENVSIEEFYDTKGDGGVGVQSTEGDINIGLKGSGQKVTKRIYSFEGWRDGSSIGVEAISELIKKMGGSSDDNAE
ncbi:hypothetical protein [Paraclostridium bifermentans]|uniref:hypothetical protein n=1 Tax=Paraclostridium bifermentans TaxID=1490 RepID=UPI0018A9C7D6|nr:hypothetical protein [Paraclostridium bifermentans]